MKLIGAWQRRRRGGVWRTNVYYMGRRMFSAIKRQIVRAEHFVVHRLRVGATKQKEFIKRIEKGVPVDNFRGRKWPITSPG